MSSLTLAVPQIASDVQVSQPTEGEIAVLAYQLWQQRGCPIGSADEDWFLAEAELAQEPKVSAAVA